MQLTKAYEVQQSCVVLKFNTSIPNNTPTSLYNIHMSLMPTIAPLNDFTHLVNQSLSLVNFVKKTLIDFN